MSLDPDDIDAIFSPEASIIKEILNNPIPSIITVSLRTLIDFYKIKILRLEAEGGESPSRPECLDEPYGVYYIPRQAGSIKISYAEKRDVEGNQENPIDDEWIEKMHGYLDQKLPRIGDVPPDIPVQRLDVEIVNDRIAEFAGTDTNIFELKLVSEPMEPRMKAMVQNSNNENYDSFVGDHWRKLIDFGFQLRNLNTVELVERIEKFDIGRKARRIIKWTGYRKRDISPNSPIGIAQRIRFEHLPQEFAKLKTYIVLEGTRMILDGVS